MPVFRLSIALAACLCLAAGASHAAPLRAPLIPRTVIFGNPDRVSPRISPDGRQLAYLAPLKGVMNVWVAPVNAPTRGRPVTRDTNRGIPGFFWAYNNRHIVYMRDSNGDENTHVYRVDVRTGDLKDLTPGRGFQALVQEVSHRRPNEILVALNDRNPQLHDLHRVDLRTGQKTRVFLNNRYTQVMTDDTYTPRLGLAFQPDFSMGMFRLSGDTTRPVMVIRTEDVLSTGPLMFDKTGRSVYMLDSRGRDKTALTRVDVATGKTTVLARGRYADISNVMVHPTEKRIEAVMEEYRRERWTVLDPAIRADMAALRRVAPGDPSVVSRSLDDRVWIVSYSQDNAPTPYYLYRRGARSARKLFVNKAALAGLPLAKMHALVVPARDRLPLVCYLTLPVDADPDGDGRPNRPLPTVLWIHGGPWARDNWGLDPIHQLWANRGFAVLSVNYRGSLGFGKSFLNAANKQWGGKMQTDILDAVDWAVARRIADPKRVAITGGSYGGYATLVGMTFTPERFACGVDIFGPSNLVTWMRNIPPYWVPLMPVLSDRVGDVSTEEGRAFLTSRSPLTRVNDIRRPLLVAQGANDARVPAAESDQLIDAMRRRNIPVTYVVLPDEGHGLERPQNRLAFFAVMEQFLVKHLGGRAEPIGTALRGSKMEARHGAEHVPGLPAALKRR